MTQIILLIISFVMIMIAICNYRSLSVIFPDDKSMSIGCWDSRTTEKLQSLHSGLVHNSHLSY